MGTAAYIVGVVAFLAVIGAVAALLLSASAKNEKKLRDDATTRRIAQQPWDAQGASGRGNR